MAADDLDQMRENLENEIDRWDARGIGFTWPVAFGLLLELYAAFNLQLTHDWNTLIDRIGLVLVTAGVAGELAAGSKAHSAERKLRAVNAEVEREAEANLKAADERIAGLQLETEKLRAKLADRNLTQDQSWCLSNALLDDWAGSELTVQVINENEAIRYADQLVSAFEFAGIDVVKEPPFEPGGINPGLVINIGKGMDDFATGLERALVKAEVVKWGVGTIRIFHEGRLALRVGPK